MRFCKVKRLTVTWSTIKAFSSICCAVVLISLHLTTARLHEETEDEVLPCHRSSWTAGCKARSCSLQVGRKNSPPALVAGPAGSRCTGWHCAGSPPWGDAGWGWLKCTASKPQKRGSPSSAAGARAWWRPVCGPQSWTCACRPCRPTGGNVLAGGELLEPSRARPPRSRQAPCQGRNPGCLETKHMLGRSRPGTVRRHPWLVKV